MICKTLSTVIAATTLLGADAKWLRMDEVLETEMTEASSDTNNGTLVDTCGNVLPSADNANGTLMKPMSGDIDIWAMVYNGQAANDNANALCDSLNSGDGSEDNLNKGDSPCSCGACTVLLGEGQATAVWHEGGHRDAAGVEKLMEQNKIWSQVQILYNGKDYFQDMAKGQAPQYLYIGCSDSRVPPEQMTASGPGDIFVTRNVANQVLPDDQSMIAVVNYAVEALKVSDVLVTGHYGCGGVKAALTMTDDELGLLSPWISTLKSIANAHNDTLANISNESLKVDCLVELSVYKQMENLNNYGFIQDWKKNNSLTVHPMVYDMPNGRLLKLPANGTSPACAKGLTESSSNSSQTS